MKEKYLIIISILILLFSVNTQGQTLVKGTVVSVENEEIPFCNITSSIDQVSSNINGYFEIKASEEDTHVMISAVGFKSDSVKITGSNLICVLQESNTEIADVVVTALGIKREKKSIGYALTEIEAKELELNSDPSVINRLAGKVAGLNISSTNGGAGTSSRIILRGNSSVTGNNQALIVVDGVPINNTTNSNSGDEWGGKDFGNGVSDINPDDIETITVLKGASASALYGSLASNGVILITTKSGGKKVKASYRTSLSIESPYILYNLQNKYGAGRNGKFEGAWSSNSDIPTFNTGTDFAKGSWGPEMLGQTIIDWDGKQRTFDPQPSNYEDFFRLGSIINNSISVEGRIKKINLRFSAANNSTNDIVPNAELNRNNISLKFNGELAKRLKLSGYISYVENKAFNRPGLSDSHDNPNRNFIHMPRHISLASLEGQLADADGFETTWYSAWNWMTNPFWNLQNQRSGDTRKRVFGNISLTYEFSDKLSGTIRTAPDSYTTEFYNITAQYGLINSLGDYSTRLESQNLVNTDFLIRYKNQFSENLKYFVNIGGNANYIEQTNSFKNTVGGLIEPQVYTFENSVNPIFERSTFGQIAKNSLYAFGQLEYKGMLYLDLSSRNDWSSTLPAENNSFLYNSASLGFVYSELFNRKKLPEAGFTFGKFRASYAGIGNEPGPYLLETPFQNVTNEGFGDSQFINTTLSNSGLVPELTKSIELGSDMKFFFNRLGVDFTWYHNTSFNQITNIQTSAASGIYSAIVNNGTIINKGIEIQLNATPLQKEKAEWNINVAYAKNQSEVQELGPNVDSSILYEHWRLSIEARPGNPYGDIVGFGFLRDEAGNILTDQNGMVIKDETPKILGNFTPDFTLSLAQNFTYKNWTLSALIHSQIGGDIFSGTNMYGNGYAGNFIESLEGRAEWYNSEEQRELAGISSEDWTPTGGQLIEGVYAEGTIIDGVDVSGQTNQTYINPFDYYERVSRWQDEIHEPFIYDASFVKLRELSIGYNVPLEVSKRLRLNQINLGIFGSNLWLIHSNVPNVDPESSLSNGNGQGYELYAYPNRRSFGIYLKLSI